MYAIEFCVPIRFWDYVRALILSHWFDDNEPLLTKRKSFGERVYAVFTCDNAGDVEWVENAVEDTAFFITKKIKTEG